jgi:sigma-B regulation protein RsbU (phosphoserine phosphatase)
VIDEVRLVHFRENVAELFPDDSDLEKLGAVSYMGVPLMDLDGKILGNLAVLDSRPMPEEPGGLALFRIFGARATAELQRLRAESEVRKSEEKYRRIVETAGEGFLLMDKNLNITDVNEAYCRMVGYSRQDLIGKPPFDLASHEYKQFLLLKRDELLSKEYKEFEGVVVAKDGRHVPILVHGNTLTDDQGAVIGNMAFVTDMTEQKSLELAGEVQKSLLPQKNLRIQGLDIAGRSIPCEEIGGDYFDYLLGEEYSNRPFSVVVGDITGHGVDAALLMTSARAFLRMRSSQPGSISQIVNEMNRHLTRDVLDTGRFMTLLYMTIDTDNGHLRWVRAGHDPAIVYDPLQDKLEELKGAGLALGLDEKFAYEENLKTELTSGQIIAIGTDGIWEAFNRDGEMYGKERFHSIIRKNASAEAKDILNAIYSDLDSFRSGLKPEDDITLVVIKIA